MEMPDEMPGMRKTGQGFYTKKQLLMLYKDNADFKVPGHGMVTLVAYPTQAAERVSLTTMKGTYGDALYKVDYYIRKEQ